MRPGNVTVSLILRLSRSIQQVMKKPQSFSPSVLDFIPYFMEIFVVER